MFLLSEPQFGACGFAVPSPGSPARPRMSLGTAQPDRGDDQNRRQAELVSRIARGEKAALAALYDEVSAPLYSVAYRMLADATEAQDLIQDIFLQVWRTAGSYETSRGSVFSWLVTLTRNRAIDRLRMRRRRAELLAEAAPDLHPADSSGTDSRAALWLREKAEAVRAALAGLSSDQQQAIELAFFSGLTQQEIAMRLNEPLGTIKARIRRGLLQLKAKLPVQP
jgi:RNA polymerase sigma-70 factor (ECF subfamily)